MLNLKRHPSRRKLAGSPDSDSDLPQAVAEDAWPLMRTTIPPMWQPPVGAAGFRLAVAMTTMFYGPCWTVRLSGLRGVLAALLAGAGGGGGGGGPGRTGGGAARAKAA